MSPLHHLGEFLREVLLQVPLGVARGLFLLLMLALLLWVISLPRAQTTPPRDSNRMSENLKIWAAASLLLQIVIYSLL